jgi:sulfate permease, SulP family
MPSRSSSSELLPAALYLRSAARDTAREWRDMLARRTLPANLAAGLTVTLIALPLNVALAIAAGLPPAAGLASGAVAGLVGAMFGGSRFQITGPEVALAPITLEIVSRHGLPGLAVATFLAGLFQIAFGLLRLGSLVHAIPVPVVGGFLAAVGLLVFNTQVPSLLGLADTVKSVAQLDLARDLPRISPASLAVGLTVIGLMISLPRLHRRLPAPLIALVIAVSAMSLFDLSLSTVAPMAVSLPHPTLPAFARVDLFALVPEALALALLASIDSLLCAVSVDSVSGGERTRTDQELAAQGLANLASACFGGMPVAAAIVRSVAAHEAGASTRLAAVTQSACLLGLLLAAPLLALVPQVALAAILLVVGVRLIQVRSLVAMWRMAPSEAGIFVATAASILLSDFVLGVAIGVIAALARFARQQRTALRARASVEAGSWGREQSDAAAQPSSALHVADELRLLRLEGALFFGSQRSIEDAVSALEQAAHVVVDVSAVSTVDVSGASALASALLKLTARGVQVQVTAFGSPIDPLLRRTLEHRAQGEVSLLERSADELGSLAKLRASAAALRPVGV